MGFNSNGVLKTNKSTITAKNTPATIKYDQNGAIYSASIVAMPIDTNTIITMASTSTMEYKATAENSNVSFSAAEREHWS